MIVRHVNPSGAINHNGPNECTAKTRSRPNNKAGTLDSDITSKRAIAYERPRSISISSLYVTLFVGSDARGVKTLLQSNKNIRDWQRAE